MPVTKGTCWTFALIKGKSRPWIPYLLAFLFKWLLFQSTYTQEATSGILGFRFFFFFYDLNKQLSQYILHNYFVVRRVMSMTMTGVEQQNAS